MVGQEVNRVSGLLQLCLPASPFIPHPSWSTGFVLESQDRS